MKIYIAAIVLLTLFLAALIPFASNNPDGLQKVAASLGVGESAPVWHGLMAGYSVNALGDGYLSTLTSGILGTVSVLMASIIVGNALTKRRQTPTEKE